MKDKEFMVEKIRPQYTEQENTDLDALKALDAKVKRPANVFGYTYGSIGTIVMGVIMDLAGIILVALAYPLYNRTLKKEREHIAPEILRLTDELMHK